MKIKFSFKSLIAIITIISLFQFNTIAFASDQIQNDTAEAIQANNQYVANNIDNIITCFSR